MTLEEKAGITSGKDNWFTKAIERLGIPSVRTSDGPHGLRTQDGDNNSMIEGSSATAICYPAGCASASSFDRELLYQMGSALGKECQALGVDVLLGPGVNMKRSPLCGRNFEYFSEDPLLAGQIGSAFVKGVQSQGVGTSLKHFFANNQEHRRMDSTSEMDERTMREIYLPAFETVVKEAQPWTIMAAYNKIGGVHATANKDILTNILREEWGYQGVVTSDWGATHDRVGAIQAGCDLTMPAEDTDSHIVKAVLEGSLSENELDQCVTRLLTLAFQAAENRKEGVAFPYEEHHALARKLAGESSVLLKNDGLLPLSKHNKVAFIGAYAEKPRYQGGGSSHINPYRVTGALDTAKAAGIDVIYAPAYDPLMGAATPENITEAANAARNAEVVVLFIGLPDAMESEGSDRSHMRLPADHNTLVETICSANPNTVVVLHNGSPVEMPWVDLPRAILEVYLGGEAVGEATFDVLFGDVNPSGHLAETFPKRLEDTPCYLYYGGENGVVNYNESLFMGYRYYESKKMDVLFPFGHGLSYTEFIYTNLRLDKKEMDEADDLRVTVDVTNAGSRAGKAVVQLYVAPDKQDMIRPVRELKDFVKIELDAGETKTVTFVLNNRAFAHWNPVVHNWRVENGGYTIQIGASAHDIALEERVTVHADPVPPAGGYQLSTPMGDFAKCRKGRAFLDSNLIYLMKGLVAIGFVPKEVGAMLDQIPGGITLDTVQAMGQKAAASVGVGGETSALLGQPISFLANFLPEDKKQDMYDMFRDLNHGK